MSENKAQDQEHQRLVKALIEELKRQGFEITTAACADYLPCVPVENHVPDVKTYSRKKQFTVFGLAETCSDLSAIGTEEKFAFFASRYMSSGKSKGSAVPLCIVIAKGCEPQLEALLNKLKLTQKKNIFLNTF
jgi:hypothetical protein